MLKNRTVKILLIEDEEFDVRRIRNTLAPFAERLRLVDVVSDGLSALELLRSGRSYDVVIMDFQISGGLRGEALIRKLKALDETLQIIVVTKMTMNVTDYAFANKLLEAGAIWYCTKYPGDIEDYIYQPTDFILNIINAFEHRRLQKEQLSTSRRLQETIEEVLRKKQIIGQSPAIQLLRQQIEKYAPTPTNVLILGDSGTGKELVAANIHYRSTRRFENFVPINCGSLPDNLIESELFGFEKGAFTGAAAQKPGLFEVANGGTVFLDEITELPLAAQSKLLRVIQEGEIDKIGRTGKIRVDVRVIAASNKNLLREVEEKRFRQDLYYRLNVVSIAVPPLTERTEDIPLLVEHFLHVYAAQMNLPVPAVTTEAIEVLCQYHWPGNVRELQNVMQRLLLSGVATIKRRQARQALGQAPEPTNSAFSFEAVTDRDHILPWRELETQIQKKYFRFVLSQTRTRAEAARLLGMAPPNFHRLCKKLGLD